MKIQSVNLSSLFAKLLTYLSSRIYTLGIVMVLVLIGLIGLGYNHDWTGFGAQVGSNGEKVAPKKLWDWLQLLVVPTVLSFVAFFLNRAIKRTEQKRSQEQIEEESLRNYFNSISDLIVSNSEDLTKAGTMIRNAAIARTISTLRYIKSSERTATIIRFLWATRLLSDNDDKHSSGILFNANLRGANLSGAELVNANLTNADLSGCMLVGTNFSSSHLSLSIVVEANLTNANFTRAYLDKVDFSFSNLSNTVLFRTFLREANLMFVKLDGAFILDSDFSGAINLDISQLIKAKTLWGCKLDDDIVEALRKKYPRQFDRLCQKPDFIDAIYDMESRGFLPPSIRLFADQFDRKDKTVEV